MHITVPSTADECLNGGRYWQKALLIDVGSTFTKAIVLDVKGKVLGRAQAPTTIEDDVMSGAENAIAQMPNSAKGPYDWALASSSAAGGLRMCSVGLTATLSGKAGTLAALGAGAKVVSHEAGYLGPAELKRIEETEPHLVLLAGGLDGGNEEALLHNAQMLSKLSSALGFIIAGNADIAADAARLLQNGRRDVRVVGNVFPRPGEISIHQTREVVRDLFLLHITKAKGLDHLMATLKTECEPTPLAVSRTLWGLQEDERPIVLVDLGGATTDVHSIGGIFRKRHNAELPVPDVMRTVEGDLGMRWGAPGIVTAMRSGLLSKIEAELGCDMEEETRKRRENPSYIPLVDKDRAIDNALAIAAVSIAIERHAGRLMVRHLPWGDRYYVDGKDLRPCRFLMATGGAFQYVEDPHQTVKHALSAIEDAQSPTNPSIVIDTQYSLYAVGLVAHYDRNFAAILTENLLLSKGLGKSELREVPAS